MAARVCNGGPNMADLEEEYNIKWNNHSHEALHVVNQLRAHDAFTDVLLYAEDTWFKANKMILAACSGYFQQLFLDMQSQSPTRVPCVTSVIAMRETRGDLLQLALDFMYKGEVLVPSNNLHDFMDFAEEMQIRGLRRDPGLPNVMPQASSSATSSAPASPHPAEKNNNNNNNNGPRVAPSSANGSPPPAKKMRTVPKLEAVKAEGESLGEIPSDEELENEGEYMDMNDFREEGSVQGAKSAENAVVGGNMPAFIPPEISTEDPVQRITGVTWRGIHSMTRAQWHFCGLCGYSARYQAALMRHERVHTGEKPFKCEMCDRRFTTKYWQQYHQRNSHPEVFGPNTSAIYPTVNLVGAEGGAESC